MKQKAFFIIFIGLSLEEIKQIFFEGESPILCWDNSLIVKSRTREPT